MAAVSKTDNQPSVRWTNLQVYVLAAICFILGVPAGYLLHGGGQAPRPASGSAAQEGAVRPQGQPSPEQMRAMADKAAEPLLAQLAVTPKDPGLLAKVGDVYYDTHQYDEAIRYYSNALQFDPSNANVRTDMATAIYYQGDAKRALAELDLALKYDPKHAQTLLNIGLIKWQANMDVEGAVTAWQKLLDTNPNFEQAEQVKQLIAQAKQHAGIISGTKPRTPLTR